MALVFTNCHILIAGAMQAPRRRPRPVGARGGGRASWRMSGGEVLPPPRRAAAVTAGEMPRSNARPPPSPLCHAQGAISAAFPATPPPPPPPRRTPPLRPRVAPLPPAHAAYLGVTPGRPLPLGVGALGRGVREGVSAPLPSLRPGQSPRLRALDHVRCHGARWWRGRGGGEERACVRGGASCAAAPPSSAVTGSRRDVPAAYSTV